MASVLTKPTWAIFLDISGVLARGWTEEDFAQKAEALFPGKPDLNSLEELTIGVEFFNASAVGCLCQLIERISQVAKPAIVLTSAWKTRGSIDELKRVFRKWKFAEYLIDKTPEIHHDRRWGEIRAWLNANKKRENVQKYIILDDCPTYGFPRGNLVLVNRERLLSQEDVELAWKKLNDFHPAL